MKRIMKATASAHANIALVKYWGKRDRRLNLPAAGSISATIQDLLTITTVAFRPDLEADTLMLNNHPAMTEQLDRVSRFLDLFRKAAGINLFASVESENNFPAGAGLASSASAFAALALASDAALGLNLSSQRLSELARRGSGSAARSIFGGFVEMNPGACSNGSDAFAHPLYPASHWPLELVVCITSDAQKITGSTQGMTLCGKTSPYYNAWIDSQPGDLESLRSAIDKRDFDALGRTMEHNCLKMHGLALSADPGLLYWNPATLALIHRVRQIRSSGVPAYFTIDAGPQVKIFCPPGESRKVENKIKDIDGLKRVILTTVGGAPSVKPSMD